MRLKQKEQNLICSVSGGSLPEGHLAADIISEFFLSVSCHPEVEQ